MYNFMKAFFEACLGIMQHIPESFLKNKTFWFFALGSIIIFSILSGVFIFFCY